MPKRPLSYRSATADPPRTGIFGANWSKWRGAIMRISLADEPPFIARLDDVRGQLQPIKGEIAGLAEKVASLTELDTAGKPVGVRHLPWPPDGEVCVLRTP